MDCEEGHPTRVAKGTNGLAYFRTEEMPHTRFTDEYIAESAAHVNTDG